MGNFNDPNGDYNPYAPPAAVTDTSSRDDDDEDEVLILAERGTRWWARFVDQLLLIVALLPAFFVWFPKQDPLGLALGLFGALFEFYQWYLISTTGQTLAKKWMGIKVVKMDGSPCGFVSGVLLREILLAAAGFIPVVGKLIGVVDSLMIFGDQRRCMHDQIAGTKVVLALNIR